MGVFTKYLFLGSFSFNAAASVDYIYLQAGRVRPGGGGLVRANLIFIVMGGCGGSSPIKNFMQGGHMGGFNKYLF